MEVAWLLDVSEVEDDCELEVIVAGSDEDEVDGEDDVEEEVLLVVSNDMEEDDCEELLEVLYVTGGSGGRSCTLVSSSVCGPNNAGKDSVAIAIELMACCVLCGELQGCVAGDVVSDRVAVDEEREPVSVVVSV